MQTSWHSYPKVYNLGHPHIRDIFNSNVVVEEKLDGSQFSFGLFDEEIKVRSKGKEIVLDAPEKMFIPAIDTAISLGYNGMLTEGWTYRCEFLGKPKHNTLAYDRTPKNYLMLFDVETSESTFLSPIDKQIEATKLGLECIPILHVSQKVDDPQIVKEWINQVSVLGGSQFEGIVVKNYEYFTRDGKVMMGKYVSERFREMNSKDFKKRNPSAGDIIYNLGQKYRCEARWEKAIQHLRERGDLTGTPKDIGMLMKEVNVDVLNEEKEAILEAMWKWGWPKIARQLTAGLPEWYKDKLLVAQFTKEDEDD